MNISASFIRRPIATALSMVGLLLCGLAAYPLLPVGSLPNVNYPTIAVTAQLPGAGPQTMASSNEALLPLYRQRVRFTIAQTRQRGDLGHEIAENRANIG